MTETSTPKMPDEITVAVGYNIDVNDSMQDILLQALDARRKELGWNWSDVARRAGMHRQQVDMLLKVDNPRVNTLQRLMTALGLSIVVVGTPGFNPEKGRDGEKN